MTISQSLRRYYDSQGLSPSNFHCAHLGKCNERQSPYFSTGNEAYVGTEYEKGTLPRLLFVSLDSGEGEEDPKTRTLDAVRSREEAEVVNKLHKGKHWYLTHELARLIISRFRPDLSLEEIKPYFAHTNSAKCCENKEQNAAGRSVLFKNCREFISDEIKILTPDILVTQGGWAKLAAADKFETLPLEESLKPDSLDEKTLNCPVHVLRINNKKVIWIPTHHPRHFGAFWPQRSKCWDYWGDIVLEFIRENR